MRLLRRFLKAVWRTKPPEIGCQQWREWAHKLPRSAFVIWLAGHVANDLISRRLSVTPQQMIDAVDNDLSGMMQSDAEHFLEAYYFGYPSSDPRFYRMIGIFRRIVKRKLLRQL